MFWWIVGFGAVAGGVLARRGWVPILSGAVIGAVFGLVTAIALVVMGVG